MFFSTTVFIRLGLLSWRWQVQEKTWADFILQGCWCWKISFTLGRYCVVPELLCLFSRVIAQWKAWLSAVGVAGSPVLQAIRVLLRREYRRGTEESWGSWIQYILQGAWMTKAMSKAYPFSFPGLGKWFLLACEWQSWQEDVEMEIVQDVHCTQYCSRTKWRVHTRLSFWLFWDLMALLTLIYFSLARLYEQIWGPQFPAQDPEGKILVWFQRSLCAAS